MHLRKKLKEWFSLMIAYTIIDKTYLNGTRNRWQKSIRLGLDGIT